MFEKEIKFIGDFCYNQVKSLGSNFTLEKIAAAGVHPAVVQYIAAELDYMIYSDRRKLLQQSYFDYAGKEISDHFQKISGEIKKHKKISIDDSKKLIFQAVSFNINYLVRPRWSLIKLIFNDQPVISVEEMKMLLNYLYYYEYFKKVLNGYISKRNLVQISSTEFDILINKIDNELINSSQHQVISNSFTSMGDFFNVGGVDKNRIPLNAVEIFCKEKNLTDLVLKLRKAIPNEVKRRYDKVEIERILFTPEVIQKYDKENEIETETKTEQMIEALDAEESDEESGETIEKELETTDAEKFLSPEEEEALLSLYSEETPEKIDSIEEEIVSSDSEIDEDEISDTRIEGVKTSLDMLNTIESVTESEELSSDFSESNALEETEPESLDAIDPFSSDDIIDSDEELEGIVDAIAEDLPDDEIKIDDAFISDSIESLESELDIQSDEIVSEGEGTGVEKEIVQEMISDFYGENISETDDHTNEVEAAVDSSPALIPENEKTNKKIKSLEDDLLNIFEGLDNEEFKFSDKERFSVESTDDEEIGLNKPDKEMKVQSTETTDGFDEYLKSIDEIMFKDGPIKPTVDISPSKVEEKIEISKQKVEKTRIIKNVQEVEELEEIEQMESPPTAIRVNDNNEKLSNKTRVLRQKDLFSYLRRKEVKKIVSFIFANDEEDFTNTVERIMDCHSYKEASEILKAVFTSYKISPYSKEAITFTNAVSNYFRQA